MSHQQPIDVKHLDGYTGGSRTLNEEVLRLFEKHCRDMLAQIENHAGDSRRWRQATHTLKGAARMIGAAGLADAAAAAEKVSLGDNQAILAAITRIKDESAAVHRFIEAFLAAGG